jgi:protocatechuate 3,4-dioxygenase beta subunit
MQRSVRRVVLLLMVTIGVPAYAEQPPSAAGTGIIRGHVLTADTGQPVRSAQVFILADNLPNRVTTTDAAGEYEFTELEPRSYVISATKANYVAASKPIEIASRQTVKSIDIVLPRGGVITGRVFDQYGEPVADATVLLLSVVFGEGRRTLTMVGPTASTNDLGEFRLFGLQPGPYYLGARFNYPAAMDRDGELRQRIGFATTYFPGTMNPVEAQRMTVEAGKEVRNINLVMNAVRAARVTGTITGPDGTPLTPATVTVNMADSSFPFDPSTAQVRKDGTFTLSGLAPGEYTLRANRTGASANGPETAATTFVIAGEDLDNIRVAAVKPSVATGRITADPAASRPLPRNLTVRLIDAAPSSFLASAASPARVDDDFGFELKTTPGRKLVSIDGSGPLSTRWTIRSVRLNGVDVTDTGIAFNPNQDVGGIEVEVTNRLTHVTGAVTGDRDQVRRACTVVVFWRDKRKWTINSRYQAVGYCQPDGRFGISSLPPGDFYIIAVDRIEAGEWRDPEFLERARSKASEFSLSEGESKTIDLKLSSIQRPD